MEELELILDAKAMLGEGPCWDERTQLLYWVDIIERNVNIYNPSTNENRKIDVKQKVGCVVPREYGGLVVALETGFYVLHLETEELEHIVDPESDVPENHINDGKCDPYGRFWAGSTDDIGIDEKGTLYCLHTDLSVTKKVEKVSTSNGLAWSPDNKQMYYIDSPTKKVVQYDYDYETGNINNPKDIIFFADGEGLPDGMTIDEDGNLWIAHWGGGKISRWNPNTGEQLLSISIPAIYVTSCAFGGKDLNELYITTARTEMSEEELEKYPLAGGIFRIKVNTRGLGEVAFKG